MYAEVRSLIRKDIPIWDRDICIDFLECFEPALPQTTLLCGLGEMASIPSLDDSEETLMETGTL